MEKIDTIFKFVSGVAVGVVTFIWGGLDTVFCVLLCVMAIDYITGVLTAVKSKTLSSRIGFWGIMKKVGILLIVALSHMCSVVVGIPETRSVVIGFYIANEGISILENTKKLGVPLPKKLAQVLEQIGRI